MNEQSLLQQMEHWGYYFLPKAHAHSPGYTGLLVAMRDKPTGQHFDPVSLHLKLCENGRASSRTLHIDSAIGHTLPISPGRVILRDLKHKEVEFFTFGGWIEAVSVPGETVYSLRSAAPVLAITGMPHNVSDRLAFEIEGLLARFAAQWGLNQDGFVCRLGGLNTGPFYAACIETLLVRFQENRALREAYRPLFAALRHEKQWLQESEQWPALLPSLDSMMAPPQATASS
jgi:hypothetical protein